MRDKVKDALLMGRWRDAPAFFYEIRWGDGAGGKDGGRSREVRMAEPLIGTAENARV